MSKIWKRMWIPGICFILLILTFVLSDKIGNDDVAGAFGAICIFVLFPLFLISLVWAIIKSSRQAYRVKKGLEPLPEKSANPVAKIWHSLTGYFKNQHTEFKNMSASMKGRFILLKTAGYALFIFSLVFIFKFNKSRLMIFIGTLIMIAGAVMALFAAGSSYNSGSDVVKMIQLKKPETIEKIFETFKNLKTPLGSPYLATMKLKNSKVMIFGPDKSGFYVYCYLNKSGEIFYIGDTFVNSIKSVLIGSNEPYKEVNEDELSENDLICMSSSVYLLKCNLFTMFKEYFETGNITPLEDLSKATIYQFDEKFKLLGQKFDLYDANKKAVLHIEGTAPLISIKITDPASNTELFKVVKQVDQILTTYNFYKEGKFFGTLQRDPSLYRDKFSMDTEAGKIELIENAGYIGKNYTVKINNKVIGTIMDNLDLTIRNIVFDNSVIFVYDKNYVPLLATMAVMAAREIARDRSRAYQSNLN